MENGAEEMQLTLRQWDLIEKVTNKAIETYCQILKDVGINGNNSEKWSWILQFIMKW